MVYVIPAQLGLLQREGTTAKDKSSEEQTSFPAVFKSSHSTYDSWISLGSGDKSCFKI